VVGPLARGVLSWQVIMLRLASVVLVISTLSACTVPRTALVLGAATTIAGGAMIASIKPVEHHSCEGATILCAPDIGGSLQAGANGVGYLLGGIVVAVGVGVLLSGAVGLAQEHAPEAPPPPLPPLAATHTVGMGMLPAPAPSSAAATSATRQVPDPGKVLRVRAQTAARGGRCDLAVDAARQLEKLDPTLYADLIERDDPVDRCLTWSRRNGYRM
jgi:hypothetical protein